LMSRGDRGRSAVAVVVQTGGNDLDNLGDLAMLEVLIERIRKRQPGVHFSVFARDAGRVALLGDDVHQIAVEQKGEWAIARAAYLGARRFAPFVDSALRHRLPDVYRYLIRTKARSLVNAGAVQNADMLVVCGGGFLTDAFPGQAWPVFERLRVAHESGIPFALMGQGIGPLRDASLIEAARAILPAAELIAVREPLYSPALLAELGVSPEKILVTGDDAIEPAYRSRSERIGTNIGVNLRVAGYAGTLGLDARTLRAALKAVAEKHSARLISLPVCMQDSPDTRSDVAVIRSFIDGDEISVRDAPTMTTRSLMERFADCRVVITGSYHAAVFALSQGIPAVCLSGSEYYEMKFRGLRAQFGDGCELVDMNDDEFGIALENAAGRAWVGATSVRPGLIEAAKNQIRNGYVAYDKLSSIIARKKLSSHSTVSTF